MPVPSAVALSVDPHPLLDLHAFVTVFPAPLATLDSPHWLRDLLSCEASAPISSDDRVRNAARTLLRHGGFRPAGRSKPASEYLLRTAREGGGIDAINPAVDVCNVVSLHSGIPISVVDLDRAQAPLRVGIAGAGDRYIFNASGQEIDLENLLCLFDASGPCANAVKDAQRTKTAPDTVRTLTLLWGARELAPHAENATRWYASLLERLGARVEEVTPAGLTREAGAPATTPTRSMPA